jgi:hypothetical protein
LRKEEDSDLALVQALQHGENRALNELMDRHREGLFRFVWRQVRNETDALELTMETFVRAYFNVGKFRPKAKFVRRSPVASCDLRTLRLSDSKRRQNSPEVLKVCPRDCFVISTTRNAAATPQYGFGSSFQGYLGKKQS